MKHWEQKPNFELPSKQGLYDPAFEHDACGTVEQFIWRWPKTNYGNRLYAA